MATTRTVRRRFVAAIGLIAFTAFAALPAEGFRARAEPVVGPEMPVSYPVRETPQVGDQPAVAFGGSVYLTVWRVHGRGIVATRVDRGGTVIDVGGIVLTDDPLWGMNPDVAFDGTNFLVVWEGNGAVFGKRVSPDGHVLDAVEIRLSSGPGQPLTPALDYDGASYFVVWAVTLGGSEREGDIYGTRVSPGGVVLEPADLPIVTEPGNIYGVEMAFNGSHHLVVWGFGDIYGTLVTTAGAPLSPLGTPISTVDGNQSAAEVGAIGSSFFVAWHDGRSGAIPDVYGSRVDATGAVLDPSGIAVATTPGYDAYPSVASDGTDVLVAYFSSVGDDNHLWTTRLDASGTIIEPSSVPLPVGGSESAVAFDGDNYFAIGSSDAVRGARVTRQLAVLDPLGIPVSLAANSQADLDLAFDGTNHLVVWSDDRVQGAGPGIYGGRVGPDGQTLDGTGFPISTVEEPFARPERPAVAFDGTNYLVVWTDGHDRSIKGSRVSRAGVVFDEFQVAGPGLGEWGPPEVAFGGGGYLVTWTVSEYTGSGGFDHEFRGARVSTAGQVVDPSGFTIYRSHSTSPPGEMDLAYGDTNFLVVFTGPGLNGTATLGARVFTQVPGPVPTPEIITVSAVFLTQERAPRIAWNGATHLVVWTTNPDGTDQTDIRGARVDDAGAVLDPSGLVISTAPGQQDLPTVAANGPFLVTWLDRRRAGDVDIFASRVDGDGTVAHPDGFAVATAPLQDYFSGSGTPVAAATDDGSFTVATKRFLIEAPYGSTRAFLRDMSPK